MEIKIIVNEHYSIIDIKSEELGIENIMEVEKILNEQKKTGIHYVILDFGNVQFVTPEAIQLIESKYQDWNCEDCHIVFVGLNDNVLKRFKQQQLHLILNLFPTLEEAIENFNLEVLEQDLMNEE